MKIELCISFAIENLSDIENKELNIKSVFNEHCHLFKPYGIAIIVFTVVNLWLAHFCFKPLEDILRVIRICLFTELIIYGATWSKNEEMLITLGFIEIINACTHKACLSDTSCHSIGERRKIEF